MTPEEEAAELLPDVDYQGGGLPGAGNYYIRDVRRAAVAERLRQRDELIVAFETARNEAEALVISHEGRIAALEAVCNTAVPTSWLDPMLTGPAQILGDPPYGCPEVEKLLLAIDARLKAALAERQ